jgi:diguanylate cyclase (GGDEF)-like protein
LADLLLTGSTAPDGTDIVSVVARDKGSAVMVTERGAVISVIENAIEHAPDATVAALYVDLDRFKVVHDIVGNLEALRILDLVNHRIAATVRGADLLFRLHSDEFVIVASELEHPESAEALAERVRTAVATLTELGHDLAITASVGVALSGEGQTGDELLSAAETAVYVAKGRGRNRVAVHDEELRTRTQRLMVVERQLRQAIDRKDVRFAYQPVVEIATGRVTGAEALLRLGGEVGLSAVEVVAAAEHSGLMGALGVLVLGGVDEQLGAFLRNDGTEVIMVNLSATQLADEGLVRALEALTTDRSLPPGRIAVEVPELVVRDHRKAVMRLADTVRPAFRLGVDGFGTGLLDDGAVASLPIDYVKLHRSVTTSLLTAEPAEVARMRALVERVSERGITVIALGVEDNEQAEALAAIGCTAAQGFLYAGAVTADSLLDLVATGIDVAQPHGSS